MDDAVAQFFVMVGSLCDDARLAGLEVEVTLEDGTVVDGVPAAPAEAARSREQLDETGYRRNIVIGEVQVHLPAVRRVTVGRPGPLDPRHVP
jgi:hypothetical protein